MTTNAREVRRAKPLPLQGSFLVKESVLGSEVCFKLSAVAVLVDRFLVKAPCFLWTW